MSSYRVLQLLLPVAWASTGFRPPAIPLFTTDPFTQTWLRGDTATSVNVSHWDGNEKQIAGLIRVDGRGYRFLGDSPAAAPGVSQLRVSALPTRTEFELATEQVWLNLTFLSSMFTDDFVRLSRPVYTVGVSLASRDGRPHKVEIYFDVSAQHAVNKESQQVNWGRWAEGGLEGRWLGNAEQRLVGSKGDSVNIDWGYLHLAASQASLWAGSASRARTSFMSSGALPSQPDGRMPRNVSDDLPALCLTMALGTVRQASRRIMVAYDDVKSVNYFGRLYSGLWTQTYGNIQNATVAAYQEYDQLLAKSHKHDAALMSKLGAFGDRYATLCALSYRQTLAATKLVWADDRSTVWNFLKEISTNGDMQTMDVIYPGSPMLLYTNPELLKLLLIPVLAYANNETYVRFSNPYSPHQLGTYPIADAPTSAQEPMPLENSGNMIFMLTGIIQRQHDFGWLYPKYWPMLVSWADELVRTTEYPADQICTDDFTGRLANNTNLGAKGIVALEAFATLCKAVGARTNCSYYSTVAAAYAQTWQKHAYTEANGQPHYKLSYNDLPGIPDSWSIKYNLVWQKLLGMTGPFPWDKVVKTELAYYSTKANKYGIPMDPRHTYVKTDWLSWVAAMEETDEGFHRVFDPIFDELNDTSDRNPFTDLYDTTNAHQSSGGFIARPVIGGLFAKALMASDNIH